MTDEAFFLHDGDGRFIATENTRGPWAPDAQHGGPPAALLGRAIEDAGGPGMQVARATFEILRPVPLGSLTVETEIVRPGKKVRLVHASLSADGETVMRAASWLIRTEDIHLDAPELTDDPPPGPADGYPADVIDVGTKSYMRAMEWRFVKGSFFEPGPAAAWLRMRIPLVAGEEIRPLTRVLCAADSASGISTVLDFTRYVYVNTDLTVSLHRLPAGEWICLDARTVPEANGIGLTSSDIHDESGPIGKGAQSLYIAERG